MASSKVSARFLSIRYSPFAVPPRDTSRRLGVELALERREYRAQRQHRGRDVQRVGEIAERVGDGDTPDHYVVAADNALGFALLPFPASFPYMEAPWLRFGPEAMYWAPRHVAKLWDVKSIYITENGTSAADRPAADGRVHDLDRIMFLRSYLMHLQRATSEGVPVLGYFLWSLMDNFEWSDGFEKRFGLYRVDFETRRRTPKLSASFYREVIKKNAVA
jgi:hypothetical protein